MLRSAGDNPWPIAAITFICCVLPLFTTPLIPSVDFWAHILRFEILSSQSSSDIFQENYSDNWRILPNIGLDLIGTVVAKFLSLHETGVFIASLVLATLYLGILSLSTQVHGSLQVVAIPIAALTLFSPIFTWGFINFLFGLGLMLLAVAAWLHLEGKPVRQLLFGLIASAVLVMVHALPFGFWGLVLGALELERLWRERDRGSRLVREAMSRFARLLVVGAPGLVLFAMSATAKAPAGPLSFTGRLKQHSDRGTLAERLVAEAIDRIDLLVRVGDSLLPWFDRLVGLAFWAVLFAGLALGTLRLAPRMMAAIALSLALFAVCPPGLFGSGYVDDRVPLLMISLVAASLAVRTINPPSATVLGALFGLVALHITQVTVQYSRAGDIFRDARLQLAEASLGEITGVLYFAGTGRKELAPICAPLLVSLAATGKTAVPIFANETQQPLRLDGRLKAAVEQLRHPQYTSLRKQDKSGLSMAYRQRRIAEALDLGFDNLFVCDAAGPPESDESIERMLGGNQWAVYRRR